MEKKMAHPLFSIINKIDRTHPGAGRMAAACLLSQKASKAMLIVAVPGTGKTTALDWSAKQNPHGEIKFDSITRSGLAGMDKDLSDFKGVLSVADLGAVDTQYSVKEASKVVALLCYEHRLNKKNVSIAIDITNFRGSALSTIQPSSVQKLISGADWDSVLQDKLIRYYHLRRPLRIRNEPIELDVPWGVDFAEVNISNAVIASCKRRVDTTVQQWSDARAVGHWCDFYRAASGLAGRKNVIKADVDAAHEILKPLALEPYLVLRESLSADRSFLADDCCVLTELASYGRFDHRRTIKNYRVSNRTLQRSIDRAGTWLVPGLRGKLEHVPSEQAMEVLRNSGYPVKAVS